MTWNNKDPREAVCDANRNHASILVLTNVNASAADVFVEEAWSVDGTDFRINADEPWPDHWLWTYHPRYDKWGEHRW